MAEGFTTHYSRLMNYKRQIRKKIELRTIIQSKHRDYTENFLMPQLNQAINRMRNEKTKVIRDTTLRFYLSQYRTRKFTWQQQSQPHYSTHCSK